MKPSHAQFPVAASYVYLPGLLLLALVYPMINLELRGLPLTKIFAFGLLFLVLLQKLWSSYRSGTTFHVAMPLFWPFSLLILAGVLSAVNSISPVATFSRVFLQIVAMYVVVLLVANTCRRLPQAYAVLVAMIVLGVVAASIGWLNYFQGNFQRVSSFWPRITPPTWLGGTHVTLAGVMVVILPLILPLVLIIRRWWLRVLLLGIAGLFALTTAFTLSRAGWLCLALQIPIWIWIFRRRWYVVMLAVFGAFVSLAVALEPMLALLNSNVRASSDRARDYLSQLAFDLFVQNPIVGVGFGTFTEHNQVVFDSSQWPPVALDAHGTIYKVIAETGSLGLLAVVLIWFEIGLRLVAAYRASRTDPVLRWLVLGCMISMFINTIFELSSTRFYSMQYWFPVGVYLAVARIAFVEGSAKHATVAGEGSAQQTTVDSAAPTFATAEGT